MYKCEICGREADVHHIVHKCEGGLDFPLNYKYLCVEHHRGKHGPHRDSKIDIEYKIELQQNLEKLLCKEFYNLDELAAVLELNKNKTKKLLRNLKIYKEGYEKSEIIYRLMGKERYDEIMLEEYYDIMVVNFSV